MLADRNETKTSVPLFHSSLEITLLRVSLPLNVQRYPAIGKSCLFISPNYIPTRSRQHDICKYTYYKRVMLVLWHS